MARGVQQGKIGIARREEGLLGENGNTARLFQRVGVQKGILMVHPAQLADGAGAVEQGFGKGGLAAVHMGQNADDQLLAVGISMPSLAEALQKAHGRLLPMGWYHLAKTIFLKKYPKMLDLLLVAVKPEYQNKGVNALLFSDLIPVYQQLGFEYAESNPELELNGKVQAQWEYFKTEQHKRRRCFVKGIK